MAETDVFSALNVGSGLNTSELIKNLVDAERAPKEEKINRSEFIGSCVMLSG